MSRRKDRALPGNGGQSPNGGHAGAAVSLGGDLDARTDQTLVDFLDFAETGARLVARGRAAYDEDELLCLAAEAILHRLVESVARLDDDVIDAHPQVRWRAMKGMRNLVAHEYGAVDHNILWNALEHDLPREAVAVRQILSTST